jgi:hypothetical protein
LKSLSICLVTFLFYTMVDQFKHKFHIHSYFIVEETFSIARNKRKKEYKKTINQFTYPGL